MEKTDTHDTWRTRVDSWRRSGQSARIYATGREFTDSALHYWSRRLRELEGDGRRPVVRLAQVVTPPKPPTETPIVVERGGFKVSLMRGFDREALETVVEVLSTREGAR